VLSRHAAAYQTKIDTSRATVGTGNHTWDVMYESLRFGRDSVEKHLGGIAPTVGRAGCFCHVELEGASNRVAWLALGRDRQETAEEEPGGLFCVSRLNNTSSRGF
jgi:hypothetical protein